MAQLDLPKHCQGALNIALPGFIIDAKNSHRDWSMTAEDPILPLALFIQAPSHGCRDHIRVSLSAGSAIRDLAKTAGVSGHIYNAPKRKIRTDRWASAPQLVAAEITRYVINPGKLMAFKKLAEMTTFAQREIEQTQIWEAIARRHKLRLEARNPGSGYKLNNWPTREDDGMRIHIEQRHPGSSSLEIDASPEIIDRFLAFAADLRAAPGKKSDR